MEFKIARTLAEVTQNFQVDKPLAQGDPRYVDLSGEKGDHVRRRVRKRLMGKRSGERLFIAFASHRGAGKTTELYKLREEVAPRYHVLYFESNIEVNPHIIEAENLLLVISQLVVAEMARLDLPLDQAVLVPVIEWFAQTTSTTEVGRTYQAELESQAKLGVDSAYFGALFSRFQAIMRTTSVHRDEVKATLRKFPGALLDATNKLLEAAHVRLAERHKELLIIVDNMDRYPPEAMLKLLSGSGDALTSLACNLLVTPPVVLAFNTQTANSLDPFIVEIMPAFRTRTQDMAYDDVLPSATATLDELLSKRLDLARVLPDPKARQRLYVASGGAVRELIDLVERASLELDEGPITFEAVERVVKRHRGRQRAQINANGLAALLGRIGREKTLNEDPRCLELLFARFVFEYNDTVWHDLHPLIAEIEEVAAAREPVPFR